MLLRIVFHPKAEQDLLDLYDYIADNSGPLRAWDFVERIRHSCSALSTFPQRGRSREDLRPGLRILGHRRIASIAFCVRADEVIILGIFYRGRLITRKLLKDRR